MSWRQGIMACALALGASREAWAGDPVAEISPWDFSATVGEGFGSKDNLLLSDLSHESSLFTITTADLFLLRLPTDGWEMTLLATGEDRRYWQSSTMDKEQLFITAWDVKKTIGEIWKPGFNAQYFYSDQMFDASVEEGIPLRTIAKLHRASGGPTLVVQLPNKRRVEAKMELARSNFERPLDDYWEGGQRLLFGQKYGNGSDLTISYAERLRAYDTLSEQNSGGTLRFSIREVELGNRHYFDQEKEWSVRTRAALEWTTDNGNDFNNYRRWRLAKELGFERGGFDGTFKAQLLHYEYGKQTGIDLRARRRSEVTFNLRAEQEIFKRVRVFFEYEHEWVMARDQSERYRANTIVTGVEWDVK